MLFVPIIISVVAFCIAIGCGYYTFFNQPSKLKRLNKQIQEQSALKSSLEVNIHKQYSEKTELDNDLKKTNSALSEAQQEFKTVSTLIMESKAKFDSLEKDSRQILQGIAEANIEIAHLNYSIQSLTEKTSVTQNELSKLSKQKVELSKEVLSIENQMSLLKKEQVELVERKADLENENSHLSLEIAKKKISYGTNVMKYQDEQGDIRGIKYIGYKPSNSFSNHTYPLVSMPKENSVIKFPRKGRLGTRGFKEPSFEEDLKTFFYRQRNLELHNDRFLLVSNKTRPYEPDFTIIDEKDGLNLFIDIEIDEPYDGIGRIATHTLGSDNYRNQYFNNRGWVIIRFSERQVHENAKGCCRFIAEVIKSLNSKFVIPQELQNAPIVLEESLWDKVQAEKWQKDMFREKYLGLYPNGFTANQKTIVDSDNLFQNSTEKDVEEKVSSTPFATQPIKGTINEINKHHRDNRIKFLPEPHIYLIDDNPKTISASTLVKKFFPDFDSRYWSEYKAQQQGRLAKDLIDEWEINRQQAATLGTALHSDIERFFDSDKQLVPNNKKEFRLFLNFYEEHLKNFKLYRTEWKIFDDLLYVAGTADMIFKKQDGTYAIYDWKRSKDIKTSNRFNNGIGVCSDFSDCNYNHYSLQLNIYKKILEEHYSKPVSEMHFVQLHPNFDTYNIFTVPDLGMKVNQMFEATLA